jgi:hypothetical protein
VKLISIKLERVEFGPTMPQLLPFAKAVCPRG